MKTSRHRIVIASRRNRRGAIFVVALAIVVILAAMTLVLAQSMRTEASASANRLSFAQADAVEQGAEMWVMGQVESYPGDAATIIAEPAEALQIGNGYFWVIAIDSTQSQTMAFGITDEAGKLNLNNADASSLALLPRMNEEIAGYVQTWRTPGADSSYYNSLQDPYSAKGSPFETVDELLLVQDVTPTLLYGQDLNRNGVIELAEQNAGGGLTLTTGVSDTTRGFINDVTCYSADTANSSTGSAKVDVNSSLTGNVSQLQTALSNAISSSRASAIITRLQAAVPRGQQPRFTMGTFYTNSGMSPTEFGKVFDTVTARIQGGPPVNTAKINVNTASQAVLATLPGLTTGDAQTIYSAQSGADKTNISWFFTALGSNGQKIANVADSITSHSYQYSADIVAVSGDGRAFKRVKIVVDSSTIPSKIVYRKDLTSLGWPLDPQTRIDMRAGRVPQIGNQLGTNSVTNH